MINKSGLNTHSNILAVKRHHCGASLAATAQRLNPLDSPSESKSISETFWVIN